METKIELFPANNPNPVLNVTKDGTVLYSNKAGEPLLHEWDVVVGEKLPSSIGDIVQRVISRNTPEKMKVKAGNRVYLIVFHLLPEQEYVNIYGFDISDQKDLERKLRESEEDLAEVQKMAHIGNWKWNIVTNELCWSDEVYHIFGLNPQEFEATFDAYFNYVHPDDRDYLNDAIKEAFKGEPYSVDNRIITANGEERIVHTDAEITFNEDNIPVYARGIVQDITERKQIKEILSESSHKVAEAVEAERQRLFDMLETLPAMICLLTLDYHVTFANRSFRERFGESDGRHCYEYCFGRTKPCEFCESYKVLETGQSHHWEVTGPDRSVIDAYDFPFTDVDVSPTILEMDIDITEQKKAEAKLKDTLDNLEEKVKERTAELDKAYKSLKESEERLAEAQKLAHVGSYDWDIATNEEYWSDELYRVFKLDPQFELNHNKFLNRIHPEDLEFLSHAINEALNGKPYNINYRKILPDGEERVIDSHGGVIFDEKNRPIRMRGIVQDITERKKAEESLERIEIARKKETHHRIKNNLQVISSLLDLQAEKFKNRENIKDSEVLEAFRESQDRVMSMAFIHEELHKGEEFEKLNLSSYIEKLAENLLMTYRLGNSGINLNTYLSENILFDLDIAVPFGIIINELISNSLKYAFPNRDKGEIRINLHREENRECKTEDCNPAYVLSVSDNGIGIPEDLDIENLDSLGLKLVTTLVDQLDGELELKRNNGTEFIIRFTVTEESDQASEPVY